MTEKQASIVGRRARKIRKEQGKTAEEVAEEIGISRSYLSHIELGDVDSPTLKTTSKIADALGVTMSDLLDEDPGKSNISVSEVDKETKEALQLFEEVLTDPEIPLGRIYKIRKELVNHAKWLRAREKGGDFNE